MVSLVPRDEEEQMALISLKLARIAEIGLEESYD